MDAVPVIRTLQEILESRQSRGGAWGFVADQDAVEPTCFVILALRHQPSVHVERASDALGNLQNKDGSWPAFRRRRARRVLDHGPSGSKPDGDPARLWACAS